MSTHFADVVSEQVAAQLPQHHGRPSIDGAQVRAHGKLGLLQHPLSLDHLLTLTLLGWQ